jgi:hypothetical protein
LLQLGFRVTTVDFSQHYVFQASLKRMHELKIGRDVLADHVSRVAGKQPPSPYLDNDNVMPPQGKLLTQHFLVCLFALPQIWIAMAVTLARLPTIPSQPFVHLSDTRIGRRGRASSEGAA